jgi:hypothetical protein
MNARLTKNLPEYIHSITGKTISGTQLNAIITKLNVKEKCKDAQSSRNSFYAHLETGK